MKFHALFLHIVTTEMIKDSHLLSEIHTNLINTSSYQGLTKFYKILYALVFEIAATKIVSQIDRQTRIFQKQPHCVQDIPKCVNPLKTDIFPLFQCFLLMCLEENNFY